MEIIINNRGTNAEKHMELKPNIVTNRTSHKSRYLEFNRSFKLQMDKKEEMSDFINRKLSQRKSDSLKQSFQADHPPVDDSLKAEPSTHIPGLPLTALARKEVISIPSRENLFIIFHKASLAYSSERLFETLHDINKKLCLDFNASFAELCIWNKQTLDLLNDRHHSATCRHRDCVGNSDVVVLRHTNKGHQMRVKDNRKCSYAFDLLFSEITAIETDKRIVFKHNSLLVPIRNNFGTNTPQIIGVLILADVSHKGRSQNKDDRIVEERMVNVEKHVCLKDLAALIDSLFGCVCLDLRIDCLQANMQKILAVSKFVVSSNNVGRRKRPRLANDGSETEAADCARIRGVRTADSQLRSGQWQLHECESQPFVQTADNATQMRRLLLHSSERPVTRGDAKPERQRRPNGSRSRRVRRRHRQPVADRQTEGSDLRSAD